MASPDTTYVRRISFLTQEEREESNTSMGLARHDRHKQRQAARSMPVYTTRSPSYAEMPKHQKEHNASSLSELVRARRAARG